MKQYLLIPIALCMASLALAQPPTVYYTTENARCFGSADGAIVLNINGGLPPYHYTVNGGPTTILNQPGGWQWAASAGGSSDADAAWQVVVDAAGNSFVTGAFSGTVNFGTATITAAGGTDVFLAKYNPSGTLAWVRRAGGNGVDKALAMALTSTGEL
ncbi:MAG: SprB repeat-containing protein, partial [Bacteroidota bacterium]